MGKYSPDNNNALYQHLPVALPRGMWSMPAFFNNTLYVYGQNSRISAFTIANGVFNTTPVQTPDTYGNKGGATVCISANGTTNGILWLLAPEPPAGITTLRAYNADNLSQKLYDSYTSMPANSSNQISFVKFVVPTIANGKVYVGTTDALAVFGLRAGKPRDKTPSTSRRNVIDCFTRPSAL